MPWMNSPKLSSDQITVGKGQLTHTTIYVNILNMFINATWGGGASILILYGEM